MKAPSDDTATHFHGVDIADPHRPLENLDAAETLAWIEYQQQRTEANIIDRKAVAAHIAEIRQILDYPKRNLPIRRGNRKFFFANDGRQQQDVLMMQEGDGEPTPLIDPNTWPAEEARALAAYAPSPDGRYVGFLTNKKGDDWKTLQLMDIDNGELIDGEFPPCRLSVWPVWRPDSRSFIYWRPTADRPEIDAGGDPGSKIFEHRVGTDPTQDAVYYEPPAWAHRSNRMYAYCSARISLETGDEFVFLWWGSTAENAVYWRDPQGELVELLASDRGARLDPVASNDGCFYGRTTLDALRGRIVRIDPANPGSGTWRTIVPERADEVLKEFALVGDQLLVVWRRNTAEYIEAFSRTGKPLGTVYAPEMSSLHLQQEHPCDTRAQIREASHRSPYIFHHYDACARQLTFLDKATIARDLMGGDIVIERAEAGSKDGVQVPMVIIYDRTKVKLDGTTRARMYGYGGFGVENAVGFNTMTMHFIEQGGIFVDTFIRGGGNKGRAWHLAATKANKQKCCDDFIACAEYLHKHDYTSPGRLEIAGVSHGGFMVLACALQRPGLFGAVIADMPITDLIRFSKATAGPNWLDEFGDPEKADEFRHLLKISPLHNINWGVRYPAIFITTGSNDVRVVPWHAYKFVATMQKLSPETPCYLNIINNAGHFGAVGLDKRLEVDSIKECFASRILGPIPPQEYKIWKAAQKTANAPARPRCGVISRP